MKSESATEHGMRLEDIRKALRTKGARISIEIPTQPRYEAHYTITGKEITLYKLGPKAALMRAFEYLLYKVGE